MAFKIPRVHTSDRLINQIQQNIAGQIEPIFDALSGSFVLTLTGCSDSAAPQGIVTWQRDTQLGPIVMQIPTIEGTSNAVTALLTGLPPEIWPSSTQYILARVIDNGTVAVGVLIMRNDGTMQLGPDQNGAVFTASGTKGIAQAVFTYMTSN